MGRIPLPLDMLILDEIGKNISGAGMDTKVVNRSVYGESNPWPDEPRIERIFVRDLERRTPTATASASEWRTWCMTGCSQKDRLECNLDQFADRLHARGDPHADSLPERPRVPGANRAHGGQTGSRRT